MKTSELSGSELDRWVALALGWHQNGGFWCGAVDITGRVTRDDRPVQAEIEKFRPSSVWAQGGQIIEREGIAVARFTYETPAEGRWRAEIVDGGSYFASVSMGNKGPTPLVAAMRCYVASKFDEEVSDHPQ